jgi:hypothetical protein
MEKRWMRFVGRQSQSTILAHAKTHSRARKAGCREAEGLRQVGELDITQLVDGNVGVHSMCLKNIFSGNLTK